MGMIGHYIAADVDIIQQIGDNQLNLLDLESDGYPTLDIDKSWQAIHFLLCGEIAEGEPPWGFVVPMRQDNLLEDVDMDCGAFALTPQQTREVYNAIKDINEEMLRRRYDFNLLVKNGIYPMFDDENPEGVFGYILEYFQDIREFYKEASQYNYGIVFYIM